MDFFLSYNAGCRFHGKMKANAFCMSLAKTKLVLQMTAPRLLRVSQGTLVFPGHTCLVVNGSTHPFTELLTFVSFSLFSWAESDLYHHCCLVGGLLPSGQTRIPKSKEILDEMNKIPQLLIFTLREKRSMELMCHAQKHKVP